MPWALSHSLLSSGTSVTSVINRCYRLLFPLVRRPIIHVFHFTIVHLGPNSIAFVASSCIKLRMDHWELKGMFSYHKSRAWRPRSWSSATSPSTATSSSRLIQAWLNLIISPIVRVLRSSKCPHWDHLFVAFDASSCFLVRLYHRPFRGLTVAASNLTLELFRGLLLAAPQPNYQRFSLRPAAPSTLLILMGRD